MGVGVVVVVVVGGGGGKGNFGPHLALPGEARLGPGKAGQLRTGPIMRDQSLWSSPHTTIRCVPLGGLFGWRPFAGYPLSNNADAGDYFGVRV